MKNYNLAIASYVTAYARLELYRLMTRIENLRPGSLLYFDTDSVQYVEHKDDVKVKTGDFLGELTDEIPNDEVCIEFVALGPKSYGNITKNKVTGKLKTSLKIKGIYLNEMTENVVSFESIRLMAEEYLEWKEKIEYKVPQCQIRCDRHEILKTLNLEKVLRVTSDKRKIKDCLTYPYGYIYDENEMEIE